MLNEELLIGAKPYFIHVSRHLDFELHRHLEIELKYCSKGSYITKINNRPYSLTEGCLAVIGSLVPHESPYSGDMVTLTIKIGPIFLKEHFQLFARSDFAPIYNLNELKTDSKEIEVLQEILEETTQLVLKHDSSLELLIQGNIYRISSYIIHHLLKNTEIAQAKTKDVHMADNIMKSIELVYDRYMDDITVEEAARISGYGKSTFCRHFKAVTGCNFHRFLNQYRVETACYFLKETKYPLSEIATLVGFSEPDILCRAFRSHLGITPSEYRAQHKQTT